MITHSQKDKKFLKDFISSKLHKSLDKNHPPLPDVLKDPKEWRTFNYNGKNLPYLYIDGRDKNGNLKDENVKYFVICHGALTTLESAYVEYQHIAKCHQIILICLEYPGFGSRAKLNEKPTEELLLIRYPLELISLINNELSLPCDRTILIGTCLGSVVATSCLSIATNGISGISGISDKITSLVLAKPLSSIENGVRDTADISFKISIPTMFDIEPFIKKIKAKIICVQGETDKTCRLSRTRDLLSKFTNASSVNLIVANNYDHDMKLFHALSLVDFYEGDREYKQL